MFRFILTTASIGAAAALALAWALLMPARAHDYKRPDLDGWYGTPERPNFRMLQQRGLPYDRGRAAQRGMVGADWSPSYRAGWRQPRLGIARLGPHTG
jgi:hypothetical protein